MYKKVDQTHKCTSGCRCTTSKNLKIYTTNIYKEKKNPHLFHFFWIRILFHVFQLSSLSLSDIIYMNSEFRWKSDADDVVMINGGNLIDCFDSQAWLLTKMENGDWDEMRWDEMTTTTTCQSISLNNIMNII